MATLNIETSRHGRKFYRLTYNQGGRQHRENIGFVTGPGSITPHDAKIAYQAKQQEIDTGEPQFTGTGSVDDSAADYLTWHAVQFSCNGVPTAHHARVAGIIRDALAAVDKKGKRFFGGRRWNEVTPKVVTQWVTWRQTQCTTVRCKASPTGRRTTNTRLAPSTVAKELRHLSAWFAFAVKQEDIRKNPAEDVAQPIDTHDTVVRYYEPDQLAALFALPLHGRHWEWFACNGLRRGEERRLTHGDVKLHLREIHINSLATQRTKGARRRVVVMSDDAVRVYGQLVKAAKRAFRERNKRLPSPAELAAEPVLPKMAGPSWSRAFRKDRDRLGLPAYKGSLVHALRHSYGVLSIRGGCNVRALQKLLGHASVATTEKYTEIGNADLHREGRKLSLAVAPRRRAA